ncbi:MAG: ATP-binding protein [Ekhidna sp.]
MREIFRRRQIAIKYSLIAIWIIFFLKTSPASAQKLAKDSLENEIEKAKSVLYFERDTTYINLLYELGRELSFYNSDSLLLLSNEIIKLSESIGYSKGEVKGMINLGSYHSETGNQDQALEFFRLALSKAHEINDLELILKSKNLLAIEYEYKEDYAIALREYLDGIKIAEKNKLDLWLSTFYVNVSNLYNVQKDHKQGIVFLNKAKELSLKNNDDKVAAISLANLTSSYIEIGDLEKAEQSISHSITLLEELELNEWLTYAYELRANIALKKEQYTVALLWLKKSETIHKGIKQIRYKIPLYNVYSKVYFAMGDFDKAEVYALKALEMSKKIKILDERDEILNLLSVLKKNQGNYPASLAYLEEFISVSDTIEANKNERELKILKSKLEFEQEKEVYLIESKKILEQQRFYFYMALVVILAFAVIIYFLRINNRQKDEFNLQLTHKTSELHKSIITKNKLFSIIGHDLKGPINLFKSMFDLLDSGDITKDQFFDLIPETGPQLNSISFTLNNLLYWGQAQMDLSTTNPDTIDLRKIVDENISLLSKGAKKKLIQLESKIEQEVIVWSDRDQIDIVIRNLISNALKFTPENGSISVGAVEKSNLWEIFVEDNGIGMDEETIELVFNKSESYSSLGTLHEKGTGLGIGLCQEMIKKNNGNIWVESSPNMGSKFSFTVPKNNQES